MKSQNIDANAKRSPALANEVQQHRITIEILRKYERVIYDAINEALSNSSARDYSVSAEDIYQEVAMLICARAQLLTKAGTAKLSTRLYSLAKKHVWFAHTSYWNRRHRINRKIVERGSWYPVERISDEEIAAMKPKHDAESDLGYGEVKLSLE